MKLIINDYYKSIRPISVRMSNKRNNSKQYRIEIVVESDKLSAYDREKFEDTIKEILNQD